MLAAVVPTQNFLDIPVIAAIETSAVSSNPHRRGHTDRPSLCWDTCLQPLGTATRHTLTCFQGCRR